MQLPFYGSAKRMQLPFYESARCAYMHDDCLIMQGETAPTPPTPRKLSSGVWRGDLFALVGYSQAAQQACAGKHGIKLSLLSE